MAWWRQADCPVRPVEQEWIEQSLEWLRVEFGDARLRGPVVLPTDDWFPGEYRGSRADVRRVLGLLCRHMGIGPDRIVLEHEEINDEELELSAHVPLTTSGRGAAGHFQTRDGRCVVTVRDDQAARPMALVATLAHELGHVLLHGDQRISAARRDGEPLTDLLTVAFGLGIFTANAAFEVATEDRGRYSYTTRRQLGYLTEPMHGYALARYAWLRDETDPDWARYLDTNPRACLRQGLRFLAAR
jgi:hypothetical protein